MEPGFYRRRGKRWLDLCLTVPGLLVTLPLLAVIALVVRWRLGAPVLFRQERSGRNGVPFVLPKFRTMTDERDSQGSLLPDDRRVTRLGRFLRRTSLDELPELFCVLKGEMSLVGPRPLVVAYLAHYSDSQRRRLEVRPGITGWAAIHGRNAQSWESIFAHDVWYVDHVGLRLDLSILLRTFLVVIRRHGIDRPDDEPADFAGDRTR